MDKKKKRLSEFENWIQAFTVVFNAGDQKIRAIDNAANILNEIYWQYAESYIRPIIDEGFSEKIDYQDEGKISRFKIVSTTELTIVDVQPFATENPSDNERLINAEFAWFVAYSILCDFSEFELKDETVQFLRNYKEPIPGIDNLKMLSIFEEHISWLSQLEPDVQLPIISNAQTWRLYYFSLLTLQGQINIRP